MYLAGWWTLGVPVANTGTLPDLLRTQFKVSINCPDSRGESDQKASRPIPSSAYLLRTLIKIRERDDETGLLHGCHTAPAVILSNGAFSRLISTHPSPIVLGTSPHPPRPSSVPLPLVSPTTLAATTT